jgi:hypothetical protein
MAVAGTYSFTRLDGASTFVAVTWAFLVDSLAIELAVTEKLLPGVIYVLAATGVTGSSQLLFLFPPVQATPGSTDDPEAEAFGVDLDWLASALAANGDLPVLRGRAAYKSSLVSIALTERGEIFHRPNDGAGMPSEINGTEDLPRIEAALRREWLKDPRTQKAEVSTRLSSNGELTATAVLTPVALANTIPLTVRR